MTVAAVSVNIGTMMETHEKTPQNSLYAPPVYRRFLGGGVTSLRLGFRGVSFVVAAGLAATAAAAAVHDGFLHPSLTLSSALAVTLGGLAVAAVAARWLGGRVGVFAGCLYALSGRMLMHGCTASDQWLAALSVMAVGIYAAGNVAGRLPVASKRYSSLVFYCFLTIILCVSDPMTAAAVLLTCLAYNVVGQECRGMGFFIDWPGPAVVAAVMVIAWYLPAGYAPSWYQQSWGQVFSLDSGNISELAQQLYHLLIVIIPIDLLPWGPLALVAIFVGLRYGHFSVPFGKFLMLWTLTPLVLVMTGLVGVEPTASLVYGPLVVLCGLGLRETLGKIRKLKRAFAH